MIVSEWINVNGATIEKKFFEENVREAKGYEWQVAEDDSPAGHVHCMVCGIAIKRDTSNLESRYKSRGGWLCRYCYENFVK